MQFEAYEKFTKWVMGFIGLLGLFHLWGVFQAVTAPSFSELMAAGLEAQLLSAKVQQLVGLVYMAAAVLALMWIRRANIMARVLGAREMEFAPGWAIGWYFIPVVNFWKPFQAMREIWKASSGEPDWSNEPTPAFLKVWWVFWIMPFFFFITIMVWSITLVIQQGGPTSPDFMPQAMMKFAVPGAIMYLIQDICFFFLIHKVMERQRLTHAAGGVANVFS